MYLALRETYSFHPVDSRPRYRMTGTEGFLDELDVRSVGVSSIGVNGVRRWRAETHPQIRTNRQKNRQAGGRIGIQQFRRIFIASAVVRSVGSDCDM